MGKKAVPPGATPASELDQQIRDQLVRIRALLYDALEAGKYLPPGESWKPHHSGEILHFIDRTIGERRPGALVLAEELTGEIVAESVSNTFPSYILVGGRLHPGVDLGHARTERISQAADTQPYWAAYVLDGAVLVTLGASPSSCRLIGEVLNLQMPRPFIQRRICAHCHALNDYHAALCSNCAQPLSATGRL